jgi:hypothetical protein
MFDNRYFDLLAGKTRSLTMEIFLPSDHMGTALGSLLVEATNAVQNWISLDLQSN